MCKGPEVEGTSLLLRNCRKAHQAAAQGMRLCGTSWRVNQRTDHARHYRPSKDFNVYPTEAHGTKVYRANSDSFSQITNAVYTCLEEH